ncbi:MAG: hypothetical protein H7A25_10030 [Leptospiraceae bacterium]|nr:hypothetical protein [Leptospiraceae bacterium]
MKILCLLLSMSVFLLFCDTPKKACYDKCSKKKDQCMMLQVATTAPILASPTGSSSVKYVEKKEDDSTTNPNDYVQNSEKISAPSYLSGFITTYYTFERFTGNLSSSTDIDHFLLGYSSINNGSDSYPITVESGEVECTIYKLVKNYEPFFDPSLDPKEKDPANLPDYFTYMGKINSSSSYTYTLPASQAFGDYLKLHCYLPSGKTPGEYKLLFTVQKAGVVGHLDTGQIMALNSIISCEKEEKDCEKKCNKSNPF